MLCAKDRIYFFIFQECICVTRICGQGYSVVLTMVIMLSFYPFFSLAHEFCSSLLNLLDQNEFDSEEDFLRKYGDMKAAEQVIPPWHMFCLPPYVFQYAILDSV